MSEGVEWVDVVLCRWGRWAIRCESGALGFASSSIMACSGDGDGFDSSVPRGVSDGDMEAVDCAVRRLPDVLRCVIIGVYVSGQGRSARYHAQFLGISRQALTEYVRQAHQKIVLDISLMGCQNQRQSVNRGSSPARIQPALA